MSAGTGCFLHLTDPHLPPEGELLYGRDPVPRFDAVLTDIRARHGPNGPAPAEFAVITGDLVRDGEPAAYARLASRLATLPFPAHLLVGNHDDRAALRAALPNTPTDEDGFVQQAVRSTLGLCLMLDTVEPGQPHGVLCARRLRWLAAQLAASTGPILLFVHHPPFPIGVPAMDALALREPERLWAVLAPHAARMRHVFFGHVHRPVAGSWHGIPVSSITGSAFRVPLEFQDRHVVPTGHEAPCYAVVRGDATGLVVLPRGVPWPPLPPR